MALEPLLSEHLNSKLRQMLVLVAMFIYYSNLWAMVLDEAMILFSVQHFWDLVLSFFVLN